MTQEGLGQRELARRQFDVASVDPGPAGPQIQLQTAAGQHRRLRGTLGAQPASHASQQLLEPEGFGHVVIRAALESGDGVLHTVTGRQHNHRDGVAVGAQLAQHLESVDPGQTDVEHQQVETPGGRVLVGRPSVCHDRDREPVGGQPFFDEARNPGLVFGDENPGHGAPLTGTMTVKVAPRPGALSSTTVPP